MTGGPRIVVVAAVIERNGLFLVARRLRGTHLAGYWEFPGGKVHEGDLVFMHLAHKELHVGIAIDDERFIHAPSKGAHVRIDSLAAPPYARGFLGARRIVVAQ